MSADPRVKIGCAALVWRDDHLLMLRRSPTVSHGGGTWSVPGGWVDYGEHPGQAIRRELREETGLVATTTHLSALVANTYDDLDMHVVCTFFDVEAEGIAHNAEPDKADALLWVPRAEIAEYAPRFPPFESLVRTGVLW